MKEWQVKLEAGVKPYCQLLEAFLEAQSKQRCLVGRALRRHRAATMMSVMCCDYSDIELGEVGFFKSFILNFFSLIDPLTNEYPAHNYNYLCKVYFRKI